MKKYLAVALMLLWTSMSIMTHAQTVTISVTQADTFAIKGLPDQPVLKMTINTGVSTSFTLQKLVIKSLSDNISDISKVKLYKTIYNRFSLADYEGESSLVTSGITFTGDTAVFSGLTFPLDAGDNYFYIVYDLSSSSAPGNVLDASIRAGGITITGTTYPTALQSPAGSVKIRQKYFSSNFESFNSSKIPNNWSVSGDANGQWGSQTGGYSSNPAGAKSGTYNARSYAENYTGRVSRLISKNLNLSLGTKLKLTFYHAQMYRTITGRSDSLGLYYGYTSTGPWYFIKNYTSPTTDGKWIKREIDLPDAMIRSSVYLVFKGTAQYGFGVCVDSVTIYEAGNAASIVNSITCAQNSSAVVAQGSANNPIFRFNIGVKGNTGTLNFTSLTAKSGNTTDADISTSGVKLYHTNDSIFTTPTLIGTGTFSGGFVTINGFTQKLASGDNYYWISYDIPKTATPEDILDLSIPAGGIIISDGGTYPSAEEAPDGNKVVKQTVFFDDFETDKGWTLTGDFQLAIPLGKGGTSYGFTDPKTAYSQSYVLGNDLTTDGDYSKYTRNLATSPWISAKNFKNTKLNYARWLNAENLDSAVIEYQYDGESVWHIYWDTPTTTIEGSWTQYSESTVNLFDRKKFRMRYRLGTTNNLEEYSGWNIDCFFVTGDSIEYDAAVTRYISPLSACGLTSGENVKVRIKNAGPKTLTNIPVKLSLDGGKTWRTETLSGNLNVNDSVDFTFSTVNLSKKGIYNIVVKTAYPGDDYSNNDSILYDLTSVPTFTLPYQNSFETDTTYWLAGGLNSSWSNGVPGGAEFTGAFDGENCWKTNLQSGYFYLYENSYLLSPCFNLSNIDAPIADFQNRFYNSEQTSGAMMEYSLDGGSTWTYIPKDAYAFDWKWYNDNVTAFSGSPKGWTGRSINEASETSWLNEKQVMPSATANKSMVRFRYHFKADSSLIYYYPGYALDDFKLINAPQDAGITTIDNLSPVVCQYTNPDKIQVSVKNFGIRKINVNDTLIIGVKVNANTAIIDTFKVTSDLAVNASRQFTMNKPVDMVAAGSYVVKAFIIDRYPEYYGTNNDTATMNIIIYPNPLTSLKDTIYTARYDTVVLKTVVDANYQYNWEYGGSSVSTAAQLNASLTGYGKHQLTVTNSISGCTTQDSSFIKQLIPDVGVENISSPTTNCGYKTLVNPVIRIKNFGTDTMKINQKIPIRIRLNSETVLSEDVTLTARFDPQTTLEVTLASKLNLLNAKTDTLKIWTNLSTDILNGNDTTSNIFVIYGYPKVFLGNDTTIKGQLTYDLDAGSGYSSYLWNDGTSNQKCTINKPGNYAVTVTNAQGCANADTIHVHMIIHDLKMQKITNPLDACTQTSSTLVKCQIKNTGTDTIQITEPIDLSFKFNGGTPETATIYPTVMMKPNDSIQYTFSTLVDMSAIGDYGFEMQSTVAGDIQPANDILIQTIHVYGNPTFDLGADKIVQALDYSVYPGHYAQYLWQDNTTDSAWVITKNKYQNNNKYVVKVTDSHGCSAKDSVYIFLIVNDLEVSNVLLPESTCASSSSELLNVKITNTGNATLTNKSVTLSYSLNGASSVNETFTYSGAAGTSTIHTFTTPIDMSNKGNYKFKVSLSMASDVQPLNDTMTFASKVLGYPDIDLGGVNDSIQTKLPYTIQANTGYAEYLWQDNSTASSFIVNSGNYDPGNTTYTVIVTDVNGCSVSKSVDVINVATDFGITGINIPLENCTRPGKDKLEVYVKNLTAILQQNKDITVKYSLNGGTEMSKSANVTLTKGATQTIMFDTEMDLSAPDTYLFDVKLEFAEDENADNNTGTYNVKVYGNPDVTFGVTNDTIRTTLPYSIDAGEGFASYLWVNNTTNRYLTVSNEGSYWVEVTDSHGCTTKDTAVVKLSTGTDHFEEVGTIQLYPNPASTYLYITLHLDNNQDMILDMVSQDGKTILKKNLTNIRDHQEDVDVSILPKGVYFVRLYNKDHKYVEKVIVK